MRAETEIDSKDNLKRIYPSDAGLLDKTGCQAYFRRLCVDQEVAYLFEWLAEEEASWAPSWKAGGRYYVLATITDRRKRRGLMTSLDMEKGFEARRRQFTFQNPEASKKNKGRIESELEHIRQTTPTVERPFYLQLCGADDTSYGKPFETLEEALNTLNELEACPIFDNLRALGIHPNN